MNTTDLDDLRTKWSETNSRLDAMAGDLQRISRSVIAGRQRSARDRLATRYRRGGIIALVMTVAWPLYCQSDIFAGGPWHLTLNLWGILFFALAAVIDFSLCAGVRAIEPADAAVNDVAVRARRLRRRHFQGMALLIPLAVGLLTVGAMDLTVEPADRQPVIMGALAGLVAGLIIAGLILYRFLRDYRSMTDDLD